jgi:hypothetical protein
MAATVRGRLAEIDQLVASAGEPEPEPEPDQPQLLD